jgi:hypothetical protein
MTFADFLDKHFLALLVTGLICGYFVLCAIEDRK